MRRLPTLRPCGPEVNSTVQDQGPRTLTGSSPASPTAKSRRECVAYGGMQPDGCDPV